ncbi:hypothetical protein WI36_13715 [Burkholderia ubonensis]|uniref:Uncharacterized protein n=1 Tax=Burkholderia ubonensis TaxID=101571 RepID=A0A102JXC4_9BURK|nr:hypothetical protein [Burkholderia ubonensis]KUZ64909.1 hypothetical protein WI35_26485 [Burkholderia ubonensis]KUZ74516.1 hypothetical protein WI36_13715 [Burkholderia ubonensis]KUZ82050.1 hypothetical protein WI38_32070 [Burkholderia ubonensis]KVA00650.1 hypothetical protein WI39_05000 [Burkholderia ubonensis]
MKRAIPLIAAVLSLAAGGSALATPVGNWQVTHYDFVKGTLINTVEVCLNVDGTFHQTNWSGYWALSQSGSNMMARETYTAGVGTGADFATIVSDDLMTGFNESWYSNNLSGGHYTTSVWRRLSNAC